MLRTFTMRLKPQAVHRTAFEAILKDSCETYNAALQERRDAWKLQRKSITYYAQCTELTELRQDPQYATISVDIQREPLRRVDRAFQAFFRRCKRGEKPGFPRFRSRDRYDSFAWSAPRVRDSSIHVPNVGDVRFKAHRPFIGKQRQAVIRRVGKNWELRLVCDTGEASPKCPVASPVGIDVGVSALVTCSDGTVIENPRFIRKHEARVSAANRKLALKQRRSKNRVRAREVLRRAHQRAANARLNYLHHASKFLVSRYDLIAHEDLKIRNMARSNLAKSILDAAWGILIWQLTYKAESAGRWVVPVNPRGTSQICSRCGAKVPKKLSNREHTCPCGLRLDRDHNAAVNILALGRSAAGLSFRRVESSPLPTHGRRT